MRYFFSLEWIPAWWQRRPSRRLARLEACLLGLTQAVRTLSEVQAEHRRGLADVRAEIYRSLNELSLAVYELGCAQARRAKPAPRRRTPKPPAKRKGRRA